MPDIYGILETERKEWTREYTEYLKGFMKLVEKELDDKDDLIKSLKERLSKYESI
jgi:hypothetical protein